MRRHRNDGYVVSRIPFLLTNGLRRLQAVHLRHLNVHEHHIKGRLLHRIDRLPAVVHQRHGVSLPLQQTNRQALVDRVVFGQEDL